MNFLLKLGAMVGLFHLLVMGMGQCDRFADSRHLASEQERLNGLMADDEARHGGEVSPETVQESQRVLRDQQDYLRKYHLGLWTKQ